MKNLVFKFALFLPLLLLSVAAHGGQIMVFAAASLKDSLKEIAAAYEKAAGDTVSFNFGASSLLARQIQEGAPADLFFSADEEKMDGLAGRGLIRKETRKSLLENTLVVVVETNSSLNIKLPEDLASASVKRLALAEPGTVPAGIYAKSYLQKTGLWEKISDRVVPVENVRAALASVEAGNADAAIVYKTDALISTKTRVAFAIPAKDGPVIRYPAAVMKEARDPGAALNFLKHLESDEAMKTFKRFGFIIPAP